MRVQIFDQFEFECWAQEAFLVIATERKGASSGRIDGLNDFYSVSESYEYFSQWQSKGFEESRKIRLCEESECVDNIVETCRNLANLTINPKQEVLLCHSEWNLLDILWEDEVNYYRVMWCMTA